MTAAALAPLVVVWWLPSWDDAVFREGLAGAILFCISVAVVEEVIFRGGIQSWLLCRADWRKHVLGFTRANWGSSVLFAAAHAWQHPVLLLPGYLGVSLLLGYFRERHHGIRAPVVLHAWYNIALLLLPRVVS